MNKILSQPMGQIPRNPDGSPLWSASVVAFALPRPQFPTMFVCPRGGWGASKHVCLDRVVATKVCRGCPIPMALIAENGTDALNKSLFEKLPALLAVEMLKNPIFWRLETKPRAKDTPKPKNKPVKRPQAKTSNLLVGVMPRHKALALAIKAGTRRATTPRVRDVVLERCYRAIKGAPRLRGRGDMMRIVREAGLPVERISGNVLAVPISPAVMDFVRAHTGQEA